MGIPTVTAISPTSGRTGGRQRVVIDGTNFQLTPAPPTTGRTTAPKPPVEVLFGAAKALDVRVLTTGKLECLSPVNDPGVVDVTVRNVDQAGVVVPGETVTIAAAFTYARPDLTGVLGNAESVLARIVRTLLKELRRQIISSVELAVHTDWDDTPDGADVAAIAKVPALVLVGPRLRLNRFFSTNEPRYVAQPDGTSIEQRPTNAYDLVFTLIGVDNVAQQAMNLQHEVVAFFERNHTLEMLRDAEDLSSEILEWEMDTEPGEDFSTQGQANNSNIRSFSGSFAVRGLEIDDADMAVKVVVPAVDVQPTGTAPDAGVQPTAVVFTGQPGTAPAEPIPATPAGVGQDGPIEQIPPEV